ncbi:MAG: hypothetical protein IJ097_04170 [Bacilli bacterium]|nr:hypothetical protein [Bacilli bacterium]
MELVEFLTSKEIIVVYIVAAVACLLCFIIYLVEKNNDRARKKHNTRELNKLVEQIKEKTEVEENKEVYQEPLIETVVEENVNSLDNVEEVSDDLYNTIQYATIEPNIEQAKEELHKITEELKAQEEIKEEVLENSKLTSYEEEQESTAIISLEELVKKSKELYEANELTQYSDEGNEPISISELEERTGKEVSNITDTFIIENVVPKEELIEDGEPVILETNKVVLDDFNTIKVEKDNENKVFKNSPFISPIYGIEKQEVSSNDLELENTADYDKLDQEIKKTNEFLMTLRELQQKLD